MKLIILSDIFYTKFDGCSEILDKENRPYICLTLKIDNKQYALPLRHNIRHPFCFHTTAPAGIDYTKAIVIESQSYIAADNPRIDTREWNMIKKNEHKIIYGFKKYLNQYRRALRNPDNPRSIPFLRYSALRYFDI